MEMMPTFRGLVAGTALLLLASGAFAQQGVQINLDPDTGEDVIGDAGNEPSLAISPVDPNQIVVGWRLFPTINSDARKAGIAYSHDGGLTFTSGGYLQPPPGWDDSAQQTDPVLAANSLGEFFYWSEVFRPGFGLYVYKSDDAGMSWEARDVEANRTSGDKGWIVIDTTGGSGDGHQYGGWNNFDFGGQCFVRSTDNGLTYSPPVRIADNGGTQWMLHFAVGPDGEVYAAWRNYNSNKIYVTKSTSAKDANAEPVFDAFGAGGQYGVDLVIDDSNDPGFLNINPVGFHQIYLGVDNSDGPRRGWVYCVWADDRNGACDINFARSNDGGFTWESGIRVNDDEPGNYQWMPAMSVAPNGRIDCMWYDTRNDSGHSVPWSEVFYSYSIDGGSTWSKNRRLSDSFDTTIGWPQQQKIGDYIDSKSDNSAMNFIYAATYNGGQDVYFMRATPLFLEVGNLVGGETAGFRVSSGQAGAPTWLAYSLSGEGETPIPQLGITLGLSNPQQAGDAVRADADGVAQWLLQIPQIGSGRNVWFQGVQREIVSNVVAQRIQ